MKRKYYIDVLKVVGLLCLILAHVEAPLVLKEVREFDVSLMVFLSGLLVTKDFNRSGSNFLAYLWKRVDRLVFPTWIFLLGFYILMFLAHQLPDVLTIIKSFLFQRDGGIAGYTWIILIYLWCAALMPLLQKFVSNKYYWLLFIVIAVFYEWLTSFTVLVDNRLLYYTFYSAVPYCLFMSIGIRYNKMGVKEKRILFLCSLGIYLIGVGTSFITNGSYPLLSDYKYPARILYFAYALPIIILLVELTKRHEAKYRRFKIIEFISKHSLWIYLWHILFMAVVRFVLVMDNWILAYIFVVFFSIFFTYIQNVLVGLVEQHKDLYILKYFKC